MSNENVEIVFRKLRYFLENKLIVHLKEFDGTWHNATVKDLVVEENLVVLIDRLRDIGMKIIPVENINPDSITEYKEVGK